MKPRELNNIFQRQHPLLRNIYINESGGKVLLSSQDSHLDIDPDTCKARDKQIPLIVIIFQNPLNHGKHLDNPRLLKLKKKHSINMRGR